jgi:N-hydroxyarylamine O-acetyltransferase
VVELQAYLSRIEFPAPVEPTLAVLEALVLAHQTHIPFENLDIQLGRPIRLDLASLEAKLVNGRRGGYCFEQNSLFAAVLKQIGFELETMEARVRQGASTVLPRTHMTLRVLLPEGRFLADVGFGAGTPLVPVPWDGRVVERHGQTLRMNAEGIRRVLQSQTASGWTDLYAVEAEPALPIDFEMGSHYTSTHPESRFVLTLTAQRVTPEASYVLRNRAYTITRGAATTVREIASGAELLDLLRDVYGLDFPPDTVFRNPVFE